MTNLIKADFNGNQVLFKNDGYLHASAIARRFGKLPKDYLKTERTKEYIKALSDRLNSSRTKILVKENQLVIVKNGGNERGTWLHPKLAIDFARWLSAEFAVWCDEQIEKIIYSQQAEPQAKLESPYIEGKQLQHIKAGVKRIVNKTGKSYQTVYGGLNHFFGAPNINEIEKGYYGRVCAYLDIPTEFEVPADTMPQQLLELKSEDHTNGLALLKFGAKVLAVQDDKLEKVAEHLNKAAVYFQEAKQCRGAIYDGFHESIVRLNVTKEENQQSNEKAEEIFESWESKRFFS